MKTIIGAFVLLAFTGLIFISCSEKSSPISPADNVTILFKKGPVVHSVQGSTNLTVFGKNAVQTVNARQYSDGSFDGQYEINAANAIDDEIMKWNGDVLFLNVDGNIGIIGGVEKTGEYAGWYDLLFVIDNDQGGQSTLNDQTGWYIASTPDLTIAQEWWNMDPLDIIAWLEIMTVDRGNIQVR